MSKYLAAVYRLSEKIVRSKTPVPGFVIGLSGTDSILAFRLMTDAIRVYGEQHNQYGAEPVKLIGIHFTKKGRKKPSWFHEHVVPWMQGYFYEKYVEVRVVEIDQNEEIDRWYHMEKIAREEGLWVAAAINATEKTLGKYSIMSKCASIWPISTFWKTEVLELLSARGMDCPEIALENARLPDCLCGRDELAAANIELIDQIIRNSVDFERFDVKLIAEMMQWVNDIKKEYDFKDRTPYMI